MDGWMDGWIDGWIDEYIVGLRVEWMDWSMTDKWMDGYIDRYINIWIQKQKNKIRA